MKLIIDIPEELYTYMQSESYDAHLDKRFDYRIRFAVRDATPLPKGHGRIGDLDELHHTFKELCNAYSINNLSFMSDMDMNFDLASTMIEADTESEG